MDLDSTPNLAPDREPRRLGGGFRRPPGDDGPVAPPSASNPQPPRQRPTGGSALTPQQVGEMFAEVSRHHMADMEEACAAAYLEALTDVADELALEDVPSGLKPLTDAIRAQYVAISAATEDAAAERAQRAAEHDADAALAAERGDTGRD